MPKAKDWRTAHRCPVGKGGRIKAQAQKTGVCFQIERVKRNGTKGFITTLHNRATGRRAGYSAKAAEGKACPLTQDPFRADIRPKGSAITAGAACARRLSVPKKFTQPVRAKKKKRAKKKVVKKRAAKKRG